MYSISIYLTGVLRHTQKCIIYMKEAIFIREGKNLALE